MIYNEYYCGVISIVGKSNVGKSTLLNKLIGHKVSIMSKKSNTTNHNVIGINTYENYQSIYIDTPGFQKNIFNNYVIANNIYINRKSIDLIICVVDILSYNLYDEEIFNNLKYLNNKVILVINKIDNIRNKKILLPYMQFINQKMKFLHIIPVSAKKSIGIDNLNKIVFSYLPSKNHLFPYNYITDQSQDLLASEIIREKILCFLNKEIPYNITIKIEKFFISKNNIYYIHAIIYVINNNHKKIIIGKNGIKIKQISLLSRMDMETIFSATVCLTVWVKITKIL
uniref:GTPase Era n=1 Tax=Candidatus Aschnera chinzeii TaxID=1485666 RepID=A0AAT9G4B1_9ENTR|nr:MAG: GTPase Era [Candidatus Aschnera chinzeii]